MDIFLGVFVPQPGSAHIWELDSDLHLHNSPQPFLDAPLPSALPAAARRPTPDDAEVEAGTAAVAEAGAGAPAGAAAQPSGEVASESGRKDVVELIEERVGRGRRRRGGAAVAA